MTPFSVTILGSSSALPTATRFPTAQIVNINERLFLIDCGEGTQIQLRKFKIKFGKINHIFISHLHGDHIFGLPGLISSLSLMGKMGELHIHAPSELQRLLDSHLQFFRNDIGYKIIFHPLNFKRPAVVFEDEKVKISSFPVKHRTPCCGFLFEEQPKAPHLRKELIERYAIPIRERVKIKGGADFVCPNGEIVSHQTLTFPANPPRRYAFCTDTKYSEKVIEAVRGVDLLYHEATFANNMASRAEETAHSTAEQAAMVAIEADVNRLAIGHFSARYKTIDQHLAEAQGLFPNTIAVNDGDILQIETH